MPRKCKYIDKTNLQRINYLAQHVLKYNRAIQDEVVDDLADDKFFPITFTMLHEHRAGVPCEPHVRCMILVQDREGNRKQLILDMESGIYDLLPEIELPEQPAEPTVEEPVS